MPKFFPKTTANAKTDAQNAPVLPQLHSYAVLLERAGELTKADAATPEKYFALLEGLAKTKLDLIQTDQVLSAIAKGLACPAKVIRAEYKATVNKLFDANDTGFVVAKETLKVFYGDGMLLKRQADGVYYLFDKSHWRLTSPDAVRGNLQQIAKGHLMKTNKTLSALVSDAIQCLHDLLASDEDLLGMTEEMPPVINCRNTEVWLTKSGTVELKTHTPSSRLFACLDYDYDPNAKCPVFDKTMLEIFAKSTDPAGMVRHFEEIMGYAISAQRHIAMFVLMVGHGRNGKSKLLETMQRLIGDHSVMCDSLATFQKDRFNMAALHGKLLFCDDDLNYGVTLNDGLIKKISESKLVSARYPYGKVKFTFRNLALPVIASNDYPNSHDISPGMMRRAHVVPFDRQFTLDEDDKERFPLIWGTEMSGVLNRALNGLQRLLQRGKFDEPQDCARGRNDFLAHANPIFAFLQECCVPAADEKMKVQAFREAFVFWAKQQGVAVNKSSKKLIRQLRGLENTFGFKVTEPENMKKVAYPMVYGMAFKPASESTE